MVQRCGIDASIVASFLGAYFGTPADDLSMDVLPLRGGLCSTVARVRVRFRDSRKNCAHTVIVKSVQGRERREAGIYGSLLRHDRSGIAPKLLGTGEAGNETSYLYLEWINSWRQWPWRNWEIAGLVLDRLAHAHTVLPTAGLSESLWDNESWDYESDLAHSAYATLEFFEVLSRRADFASFRAALPPIRRQVAHLPAIRRQLIGGSGSATVLHGDAHPGNALIRRTSGGFHAVLLDWARARLGSPLEDACSWLQSLAFWEPEARRRHDTLLRHYLAARGVSTRLDGAVRELYWLAGASNALSGALKYHLVRLADPNTPGVLQHQSAGAARDWLRVLVRADACWRR